MPRYRESAGRIGLSETTIIDYSRQGKVNRAFAVVAVVVAIVAIVLDYLYPSFFYQMLVYIGIPIGLFFLSLGMGAGSKRAIDYVPGEWEKQKIWIDFNEYENMVEQYEEAYGDLYAHPGDICSCMCSFLFIASLGFVMLILPSFSIILFDPLIDSILLITVLYAIVAVAGFVFGFRIPKIDAQEFFKAPVMGDVYEFARALAGVRGIRAGMNVEIGVREGVQTIIDAEVKSYVQGLPETVQIQVQVSHSGFAYPYLVGTVYKGGTVSPREETYRIATRYPALLEYSMDKDVIVIVARFNIPTRTSSVPHISIRDFRDLAALLAEELRDNYNPS
ncbi:MAG: hypothetical protein ACFFEE_06900 [Candidatus Thorarchaeota archaeon]